MVASAQIATPTSVVLEFQTPQTKVVWAFIGEDICARIPGFARSKPASSSATWDIPSLAASPLLAGLRRSRTDLIIRI